ncbi:MAG: NPCBM/NEW2 domain-containing protein [Bacteroidota bacterium]
MAALLVSSAARSEAQPVSGIVYPTGDSLAYVTDREGNRIPDFSHAGYRNGEHRLPTSSDVPCVSTVRPGESIQDAIDAVPEDANGDFSGAVCLTRGIFELVEPIFLNRSGIVLRGVGDDPGSPQGATILRAMWRSSEPAEVIVVGGGGWGSWRHYLDGFQSDITTDRVTVGRRSFQVSRTGNLRVGDRVLVVSPCTDRWLAAIDYGGSSQPWKSCSDVGPNPDIEYYRRVAEVSGRTVTLDAPIYTHLDRSLAPARLHRIDWSSARRHIKTNIGVEHLRVEIAFDPSVIDDRLAPDQWPYADTRHAVTAIIFKQVEDAWIRNSTLRHFSHAGVNTRVASRVTIQNVQALDPVAPYDGGRRYNFSMGGWTQLVLIRDTRATYARHGHVTNGGISTSGIVFLRTRGYNSTQPSAESHQRWSQGLLFDNHREINPRNWDQNPLIRLGDNSPGEHGWAAVHSVVWNMNVGRGTSNRWMLLQRPPTALNYAIGFTGESVSAVNRRFGTVHRPGYVEHVNEVVAPRSLYEAQLRARGFQPRSIRHLSDLEPAFVDEAGIRDGAPVMDAGVNGQPIALNGMEYDRGVTMQAGTTVVYRLDGSHSRFTSDLGTPGVAADRPIGFRVYADGALRYQSPPLTPDSETAFVDIDVRNVSELVLRVDRAPGSDRRAVGYWADARLLP